MIALCLPTWNRIEFTKGCISSFLKHTNFSIVTKYKVFDNQSTDGTIDYLKQKKVPFEIGEYNTSWKGFNQLLEEVKNDSTIKYIGKVDNDVIFTKPWIEPIIKEFELNPKIGSIRYGMSSSNNRISNLSLEGGYHGGLKIFKKEFASPIIGKNRWLGSTSISDYIKAQNHYHASMEVGIIMADIKHPHTAKSYPKSVQRKTYGKI